ncbi:hypothetical protein [Skermania sp. ID1734]|nr:hypothetical protein [Skermania sp. ID1734]
MGVTGASAPELALFDGTTVCDGVPQALISTIALDATTAAARRVHR